MTPSFAYRHWLEQGWATAAVLCNQLEACVLVYMVQSPQCSGRQFYTSAYLQASLNHVLWLGHTTNLLVPDLELLFPHGQFAIVLAEEIRT